MIGARFQFWDVWDRRRFARLAVAVLLAAGCKDATAPRVPASITFSTGSVALDALGASQQITATVFDASHEVIEGVQVTWSSNAPGVASVAGGLVTAVANGSAVVEAKVNLIAVTAVVQVAQVAVAPQKVTGDLQTAVASAAVPLALKVKIVDRLGNPMASQAVAFAAQGGGSVGTPSATSASDGTASTTWTLGPSVAQNQQVTATVGSAGGTGPSATFTAVSTAGPPAGVGFSNGGQAVVNQGATVSSTAAVRDAHGNPVASIPLTYVSRNTSIATVNAQGTIAGVARGQVVIVATSGGSQAGPAAFSDSLLAIVGVAGAPILMSNLTGFSLRSDTTRTVSVFVNMGTSQTSVSSGLITISWDPALMQFVSSSPGAGVAAVANTAGAATGSISLAFATATGATGNIEVLKLVFHAGPTPGAAGALTLAASEITANDFTDLSANLVQVVQRLVLR